MKILRIGILNLNSLKGQHLIDFTEPPLADYPLYAIVGPTGAGKTTILDAITLALYGQTERTKSLTDAKREVATVMTHGTAQCRAEVEYETGAGRFRSVWRRRRAHKKAHKDLQASERELSRWDPKAAAYMILATKKREVDQLTEEVTGLTYDRFVRSVMLTQGDFDRFLKSDTGDKAAILEQITGTEVYRQLSEGAFRRHKLAREAYERATDALAHVMPLAADLRQELEEQLVQLQKLASQQRERLTLLAAQLSAYQTAGKLADQQRAAERRSAQCQMARDTLAGDRDRLARSERLAPLRSDLDQQQQLATQRAQLSERRAVAVREVGTAEEALSAAIARGKLAATALEEFRLEEPQREQHLTEAETLEATLTTLLQQEQHGTSELARHLRSRQKFATEREDLQREIDALSRQLEGLTEAEVTTELEALERALPQLDQQLSELSTQLNYLSLQERIAAEAQVQRNLERTLEEARSREESLTKELTIAEQAVDLAVQRRQNAQLRASLEEHRQLLAEGQPCPLCGAEHHPYRQQDAPPDQPMDQLQRDITRLENARLAADNRLLTVTRQVHALTGERSGGARVVREWQHQLTQLGPAPERSREELASRQQSLEGGLQDATQRQDRLRRLRPLVPQLHITRSKLAATEQTYREVQQQVSDLEASTLTLRTQISERKQALRTLLHPHENSKTYRQQHQQRSTQLHHNCTQLQGEAQQLNVRLATVNERLKSLQEQLAARQQEASGVEARITAALGPLGLTGSQARAQLLDLSAEHQLRQRVQQTEQDLKTAQALAEQAAGEYRIAAGALQGLPTVETIDAEKQQATDDLSRVEREIGALEDRREKDDRRIEEVAHRRSELRDLERERDRWARMNDLIGSADGKKFRSFAQSITLQRLVAIGNRHLETINPRYQMSYAPPPPGSKETLDLEIIDNYMNDNRRTMETLSGGETFLISLALALGLSDLARGKQLIQSLFIDEGFGTLDGKTLDQAMATLEQLQAQGKTIGIISHVQQLRERIQCQIQLEPLGDGFSRVRLSN